MQVFGVRLMRLLALGGSQHGKVLEGGVSVIVQRPYELKFNQDDYEVEYEIYKPMQFNFGHHFRTVWIVQDLDPGEALCMLIDRMAGEH